MMRKIAGVLQLLLAASFVVSAVVAYVCGPGAHTAAEAEIARQGLPADLLARNGVRFDEGPFEIALPLAIALVLAVLGLLNLAGKPIGRTLSLIVQPIVLIAAGLIMTTQVFLVRFLTSTFAASADADLRRVDVQALVDAALTAFPAWFPAHTIVRYILGTLGSLTVMVLLAKSRRDRP